jgi:putative hydroxymethylpyrimidine transport system substrate-binding protein
MKKIIYIVLLVSISISAIAKPLTVLLDWYPNPDHAPLYVAQQQGFYQNNHLDVNLISPTDPNDPLKLVAAGKADLAITYQPSLLLAVNSGLPLIRIGTLIATPLNAVAVLKSSTIYTPKDLKGKRIGYSMDGTDHAMLKSLLASAGLTEQDVQLVNVHYGLTQALLSGKVDAISGVMRNFEPFEAQEHGQALRLFNYEDYGVPLYDELIIVARKDKLSDPRLPQFLAALTQATNYLINNPDSSWQTFAKNHPELNNDFNHDAWTATLPRFALRPAALDTSRYQQLSQYFFNAGVLKANIPTSDYAVEINYMK